MTPATDTLYLGTTPDGNRLQIAGPDLTTHGVIVGMTGSGKTGLGIILLEELLAADIPCLVLDPKGDMGNLLLNFPDFRASDFAPWVDPAEAQRKGLTTEAFASATADLWRTGLERSGITPERMRAVSEGAEVRLITPGSTAGIPLNLVGDLGAPAASWETEGEVLRDEIEGLVSGLLVMAGMDTDPLTSREHILLSNLVEHAWRGGRSLDLPTLITWIQAPPLRKLGVFDLDTFFPPGDRMALAMRLNGLMASPSFAEWFQGEPLDMDGLLRSPSGRPRASVLYLAHLSDAERLFVVARVLSKLVTWVRQQPGTSALRALLYVDEIMGYAPPTAEPPTKRPLLTLFKQARAHGVGVVVATQNPVDLDYKIMSNAGTWLVGRLQTERDKARILEGLRSASGEVDVKGWDAAIGGLAKRQFLLKSAKAAEPALFSTRWAMSYLRGPFTRSEITRLAGAGKETERGPGPAPAQPTGVEPHVASPAAAPAGMANQALAPDEIPLAPDVAQGVPVGWLDPAAPWAGKVDATGEPRRLEAGVAARIRLLFDERRGDIRHEEEWEAILFPLTDPVDPSDAFIVDYDERDFRTTPPDGATYRVPEVDLGSGRGLKAAGKALEDFLFANRSLTVLTNPHLKLYSRVGESEEDFRARCVEAAEDRADGDAQGLRERYESRLETARRRLRDQERKVRELETAAESRRREELVAGAGEVLSMFLGGRRRTRSLSGLSSRRSRTSQSGERLRSAEERLEEREGEILSLEEELQEELSEIWARWKERAESVESFQVGLERNDLTVTDLRIFFASRTPAT